MTIALDYAKHAADYAERGYTVLKGLLSKAEAQPAASAHPEITKLRGADPLHVAVDAIVTVDDQRHSLLSNCKIHRSSDRPVGGIELLKVELTFFLPTQGRIPGDWAHGCLSRPRPQVRTRPRGNREVHPMLAQRTR